MYWNIFVKPKFRMNDKVDVCVTAFSCEDEELVLSLFAKNHVGLDIITTSSHPTRERAYRQIELMESNVKSHFEFSEITMMCESCGLNPVDNEARLCYFCFHEKKYEKNTGLPWRGE